MTPDPVDDAAHPSQTHARPGSEDAPAPQPTSGEEDIVDGKNPTQRRIERESHEDDDGPAVSR